MGKKKSKKKNQEQLKQRELYFKESGQEYGKVIAVLGDMRFTVECIDGNIRLCKCRGKFRKRVWIRQGDVVLVSLREFQDKKGDIILKYTDSEVRDLRFYGELPANVNVGIVQEKQQEVVFDFDAI